MVSSLGGGGGERILLDLAGGWVGRGHEVTIVTLSTPSTDAYPVPAGVTRVALDAMGSDGGRLLAPLRLWRRIRQIRRALVATAPDVVVGFMVPTTVLALRAARGLGVATFAYELVDPQMERVQAPYGWLRRRTYPHATAVLAQTPRAKAALEALAPGCRVVVVPGFVPPFVLGAERPELADGPPVFLAVGRLTPQKGFDLLLQAFARVAPALPDWTLRVLGSGPAAAELASLAVALGVGDRVEWIPRHPAPWSFATRSSIFVLSSRYEGFPNVLLEAMAVGLPPIAFDCPSGPAEIVESGCNGVLVRCGDVEALARALQDLAGNPVRREALAAAAWAGVRQRWTLGRALDAWEKLLHAVPAIRGATQIQ